MVRTRNERISRGLEEARRVSEEAQTRLAGIEGRLAKLDSEIAGMRAQAETEGKAEEARIAAATEEERRRIVARRSRRSQRLPRKRGAS